MLIQCPDCGKSVSSAAISCNGCGAPIASRPVRRTSPWTIIGWILVVILILPVASCTALLARMDAETSQERSR